MRIDTLSTFPHMYDSVMGESIMKRAQASGVLDFHAHDLRDWTHDRHRTTDDDPYGGGQGLVDVCLYNTDRVARRLLERYAGESARQLWPDPAAFKKMGVELTGESILSRDARFVRHDPLRLAYAVMKTAARLTPRQKVLQYYDELMLRQEG